MIEEEVIRTLRKVKITHVLHLPCERIRLLLKRFTEEFRTVPLSREEEGVGISAGLYMAGEKPVMVVQSSGFGNMINALMSLTRTYSFPLPILISWRGVYGERISAQKPLGEKIRNLLSTLDIPFTVFDGRNVSDLENTVASAYEEQMITAVLLRPDIWNPSPEFKFDPRDYSSPEVSLNGGRARFTRYEILDGLKDYLDGKIVVSNLGYPSRELYEILDQPTNFYMLGSMGLVTSIALGLNIAGKEAISIDGDGSILMNTSAIFTAGLMSERGLKILVIDNSAYGSTGNQKTASIKTDLALVGMSAGLRTVRVFTPREIEKELEGDESTFVHVPARPGNADVGLIPYKPEEIRDRFMEAIK